MASDTWIITTPQRAHEALVKLSIDACTTVSRCEALPHSGSSHYVVITSATAGGN
jgi:hypothetical protein